MDLRSGHPYWLIRNGLLHTFPPLDQNVKCDVLVVGAGITGALMAWHLAEAGFSTVVLDRRDVAWGSTAASTALLQYEIDTPLRELIPRLGQDHAVRAYHACRDAIGKLHRLASRLPDPCDFALRKSLYVASTSKAATELEEEHELRRKHGFEVEWWGPQTFQRHFPFEKPGGIFSQDAAQVDPYHLAHELLVQAQSMGLRVHDRTTVEDYDLTRRGVTARTDRGATVKAKHVVFATGYEAREFLDRKIVDLRSTYALISEPLPAPVWHEECLIWEHADPYLYMRTTADHRVIIGGEDEPFHNPTERDKLLPAKSRTLQKKFARYFPNLPLEVAFAWTGTFGETKDGLAYIGQVPEYPSAFFTLGFGGNDITYSILAAEMIRDKLRGVASPYEGLFEFGR
ncbi:MAG: NAD(P)/FAD-dependent oxidoreductase [Prosthecobacter sp.]